MAKEAILLTFMVLLACSDTLAGETITSQEVEGYFYSDGEMKRANPQFEFTYYIEENTITRIRLYDLTKKQVIPDDTIYQIQRELVSDPSKGLSLSGIPVIRAIGQPGTDAIEILVIGEKFIQTVKSTSDYFVISKQRRLK